MYVPSWLAHIGSRGVGRPDNPGGGGTSSNVMGIICPSNLNRINVSTKI